jgi:hypothetical protein
MREVTVQLFGWAGEAKRPPVDPGYWAVQIRFRSPGKDQIVVVYECNDDPGNYQLALDKYNAHVKIVE